MVDLISATLVDSTLLPRRIWQAGIIVILLLMVIRVVTQRNKIAAAPATNATEDGSNGRQEVEAQPTDEREVEKADVP